MKTTLILASLLLLILFSIACAITESTIDEELKSRKVRFRFHGGINHGGIVENTDLSKVETKQFADSYWKYEVDAYSSATRAGFNDGAHWLLPVKKDNIEVGIDYMNSSQTFRYMNVKNEAYLGRRSIRISQFNFPLTYNISLFKQKFTKEHYLIELKFGGVIQYNRFTIRDYSNNFDNDYTTRPFSGGITFGIATTPIIMERGSKLGFYLDLYRGTQIYEDRFNPKSLELTGSSYIKTGVICQF